MNSSIEEFGLLLRKWESEAIKLVAISRVLTFGNYAETVFVLTGAISEIDEEHNIVRIADGDNAAHICYKNCQFSYSQVEDEEAIKALTESDRSEFLQYGDCAAVILAPNARVIIMAAKGE